MGLFDSLGDLLFGEDPEATTQQHSTLTEQQNAALKRILQQLQFGPGPESFGGDLSAGLSDREQTSLAALEELALGKARNVSEGEKALTEILQGRGQTGSFENFFQTNVQEPALRDFEEVIRPAIGREFGGSSFFSSERERADESSVNSLLRHLTSSRADLANRDRQTSMENLLKAIGLEQTGGQTEIENIFRALDSFGLEREVEQSGLDREFLEFSRQQDEKNRRIQQLLQAIGIGATENITTVDPGSAGLVQMGLAAAAQSAGRSFGSGASGLLGG